MIFEPMDRIVFAGDSVTDMGSAQPVGEGLFDNVGQSYVRIIENMLSTWYPEVYLRVTNSGDARRIRSKSGKNDSVGKRKSKGHLYFDALLYGTQSAGLDAQENGRIRCDLQKAGCKARLLSG